MRRLTQIALILLVALAVVGLQTFIVRAHADYERSDPAAGATLTEAPTQVQIWFTQDLFRRQGENHIEVHAADGTRVDLDDAAIADDDRRTMTVSLAPDLPDGIYTVHWRALSADDGHPGEGEFTFAVGDAIIAPTENAHAAHDHGQAAATPAATAEAAETPVEEVGATPTPIPTPPAGATGALPCAGSSALIIFVLGAVLMGRRRSER
ncbi:MAG: copper resistance protein CopC [Caldilineaceae bacterium]|nr:copper resistance protein CopC [Caldilineaceae bacterium]